MPPPYRVSGAGRHQLGYGTVNSIAVVGNTLNARVHIQGGGGSALLPAGSVVGTKVSLSSGNQLPKAQPLSIWFADSTGADAVEVDGQLWSGPGG